MTDASLAETRDSYDAIAAEYSDLVNSDYPQLRFEEGSMLALDMPAAGLGGLLAYYSIIHIARERRDDRCTPAGGQ